MLFHHSKRVMNILLLFITSTALAENTSRYRRTLLGEDDSSDILSLGQSCLVSVKDLSLLVKFIANRKNSSPSEIIKEIEMRLQQRRPIPPYFQIPPSNQSSIASLTQTTSVVKKNTTFDDIWKILRSTSPRSRSRPPIKSIPPPDASISMFVENAYNPIKQSISFSVTPMMNVYDALYQLSRQNRNAEITPVLVKFKQLPLGQCLVIDRIENYQQNSQFYWDIIIMDGENKLMKHGQCIPSPEDFFVLPGTRIYLVYTRKM